MKNEKKSPVDTLHDQNFTSTDVKKVSGLTYRSIRHWDEQGALSGTRSADQGWRKFSTNDLFALMIISEIHQQYGTPLHCLNWVKTTLTRENTNYLSSAIRLIEQFGLSVYLLTDFEQTLILDSDLEFLDLFKLGFFRSQESGAYIFLNVNSIVNKLLGSLKLPRLKTTDKIYEMYDTADREIKARNEQEFEVLRTIRKGSYHTITVRLKNEEIVRLDKEADYSDSVREKIEKRVQGLIEQHEYQTLTLLVKNGKVVHINQKIPQPVGAGKP